MICIAILVHFPSSLVIMMGLKVYPHVKLKVSHHVQRSETMAFFTKHVCNMNHEYVDLLG